MKKACFALLFCLIGFSPLTFAQNTPTTEEQATGLTDLKALRKMAGGQTLPRWVYEGGTRLNTNHVTISGITYDILRTCKPHHCGAEVIAVLVSPKTGRMSAVLSKSPPNKNTEKLTWYHLPSEGAIDLKTVLYASVTGSLENHPNLFHLD